MQEIRQAQRGDLGRVRKIIASGLRQCVLASSEHFDSLYAEICNDLEWGLENNEQSMFLVYEKDGSILGMVLVKKFWNLSALFVDPRHHRSGIARQLLNRVIDYCKDRSPKGCLTLNSSNYAVPFYKKMGFTQDGDAIDRPGGCVPFRYNF